MGGDAMAYNPANPDPISVAAHIARQYRLQGGIEGEELGDIYRAAVEVAREVLAGRTNVPLQEAMDLVEQARTGHALAHNLPQRTTPSVATEETPLHWTAGLIEVDEGERRWGVQADDPESGRSFRVYLDGESGFDEDGRLQQSFGVTFGVSRPFGD